jgi:hypothetical protein
MTAVFAVIDSNDRDIELLLEIKWSSNKKYFTLKILKSQLA